MSYPAYPAYQDSEVAWIGRKPKHWQVMKLHHIVRMRSGSSITSVEMDDGGEYPVFGGNGVRGRFPEYTHEGSYVLIGRQGAECGNINYAHGKFWASEHAIVAKPDRELEYRWLGETLRAMNLNQYSQAAAQPGLSVEVIGRLKLPFPPLAEQQQIAAFLDSKTEQIDKLIAQKEQLLEKLNEQRVAIITQGVTKGLNLAAPMRDSGIPWLGKVPQHWEVKKLKFIGEPFIGLTYDPDDIVDKQNGTLVLRANNIQDGRLIEDDPVFVSTDIPEWLRLIVGDILICSRNGSRHLIGKNGRVTAEFAGATFGAFNTVFRSEANAFLYWVFNSYLFEFQSGSYLTSTINQLTIGTLSAILVPLPPSEEQDQIATFLEAKTAELDSLVSEVRFAIDRLTEYRAALIAAATTGKIDVRNVKIPQPTA